MTHMANLYVTNAFSYNIAGEVTNTETHIDIPGFAHVEYALDFAFDANGNATNLILHGLAGFNLQVTNRYAYDNMDRLVMVSNRFAHARYVYDNAGRLSRKIYANGDTNYYAYDKESRLIGLTASNAGARIQGWTYGYNAMGMITAITNGADHWDYTYDDTYRLLSERYNDEHPIYMDTWEYDAAGNMTKSRSDAWNTSYYTYDFDNRLQAASAQTSDFIYVSGTIEPGPASNKWYNTTVYVKGKACRVNTNDGSFYIPNVPVKVGENDLEVIAFDVSGNGSTQTVDSTKSTSAGTQYYHDDNGNLVSNVTAGVAMNYTYDRANQLLTVVSNGVTVLRNWYDGSGRRVAKQEVVSGQTKKYLYVYSGMAVIAVLDGSNGNVLEFYTRGLGIGGDIGTIVAETRNAVSSPATYYYHNNHRGDITTVRYNATTVATYEYTAYGATKSSTGSHDSRYRFSSKETEDDVFYYFGSRFLLSDVKQWMTTDPIAERGGLNHYVAFASNPINLVDVLGHDPVSVGAALVILSSTMIFTAAYTYKNILAVNHLPSHWGGSYGATGYLGEVYYGKKYWELSSAGKSLVVGHEGRHTLGYGEKDAYTYQYYQAVRMMHQYHPSTSEFYDATLFARQAAEYLNAIFGETMPPLPEIDSLYCLWYWDQMNKKYYKKVK